MQSFYSQEQCRFTYCQSKTLIDSQDECEFLRVLACSLSSWLFLAEQFMPDIARLHFAMKLVRVMSGLSPSYVTMEDSLQVADSQVRIVNT